MLLASTRPGDRSRWPTEVEEAIGHKIKEFSVNTFFWLVLDRVTLLGDRPKSTKQLELKY